MREAPVPCVNATFHESKEGRHITWNDDRVCNPCRRTLDRFAARRAEAEQEEVDMDEPIE